MSTDHTGDQRRKLFDRLANTPVDAWRFDGVDSMTVLSALASPTVAPADERVTSGTKLWLWKNGDHFLAFTNLYPCFSPGGDPMILGEPAAWAEFRESHDRASLDQPRSGETP